MNKFNLTALSLKHKSILLYLVICVLIGGIMSYRGLGRMENPDFTIRQMVVTAVWPGATTEQMQNLVLDKLERKLQETPQLDNLKSYARPGSAVIYVTLEGTCPTEEVRPIWQEVRNLSADAALELPLGVIGPFYNDRFDDIFGSIYALTGSDYSYEQKRFYAEKIRRQLLGIEAVKRVELIGVQQEQIYIRLDPEKLATTGISIEYVQQAVSQYNAVSSAGVFHTEYDNIYIRISGMLGSTEEIGSIPLSVEGQTLRLKDIASVERQYSEPPAPKMYFNGEEAIGIAVSMAKGGNMLTLGENLSNALEGIRLNLPVGLDIDIVADQPQVVKDSINEFGRSILEAVLILLAVSFLSLGVRTGIVISFCIPLVFAAVFAFMRVAGIDLHTVSLGTLIIALGLLVDDEIIAVEMMAVKLEEGLSRFEAACSAYRITAMPMLTGTLITCAGFIPIGFARGETAEFTSAIFPVLVASLLVSWIVSVTVAPFIGYRLIKIKANEARSQGRFYRLFQSFLTSCLKHRKVVILATVLCFFASVYAMKYIQQEFFPPSKRGELLVDITLADGSSIYASENTAKRFAAFLNSHEDVKSYSFHVGEGAPRFVSSANPILPASNVSQFIIVAKDDKARDRLNLELDSLFAEGYSEARVNIQKISMGPPSAYPVMLKITGENAAVVRQIAGAVAEKLREDNNLTNINFDWNELSRSIRLRIDEARLAAMGADRMHLSNVLHSMISGVSSGEYYEDDKIIDIAFRLNEKSTRIENLENIPVALKNGHYAPLSQLVYIEYGSEEVSVWRQNLMPAVTVRANTLRGTPNDTTMKAFYDTAEIRENLPDGYKIEVTGSLEDSSKSTKYLLEQIPLMFFVIFTILMFQLKKFSLALLALLTAPIGMIGVSLSMLLANQPMGFVAQIGIIALSGMIIRNAIILLDQIEKHIQDGDSSYDAIMKSAVMRFRPIMLTSITAILAMIPLMLSNFWGPLAVSLSGGLFVGTVLTLNVLPCMYAAWFKVIYNTVEGSYEKTADVFGFNPVYLFLWRQWQWGVLQNIMQQLLPCSGCRHGGYPQIYLPVHRRRHGRGAGQSR